MLLESKPLKIMFLMLCWIASQCIALNHEFSSEHIQTNEGHFCVAQLLDKDDLITPPLLSISKVRLNDSPIVPLQYSCILLTNHSYFSARAPPTNIS